MPARPAIAVLSPIPAALFAVLSPISAALLAALLAMPTPAVARPQPYRLDQAGSSVGFEADAGGGVLRGTMPVRSADITLDLDRIAASTVTVTLDAAGARAAFPLATEAMRGPNMLDTARHPLIRFESTGFTATATGARVSGRITVRGVTRDASLEATLFRPPGSEPGAHDRLSVLLTGSLSRAAFGATGYAGLVGDEVRLRIIARIEAAD